MTDGLAGHERVDRLDRDRIGVVAGELVDDGAQLDVADLAVENGGERERDRGLARVCTEAPIQAPTRAHSCSKLLCPGGCGASGLTGSGASRNSIVT